MSHIFITRKTEKTTFNYGNDGEYMIIYKYYQNNLRLIDIL